MASVAASKPPTREWVILMVIGVLIQASVASDCPDDFVLDTDPGEPTAYVTWDDPGNESFWSWASSSTSPSSVSSDPDDGNWSCSPPPGYFGIGRHNVHCPDANCSFTITVSDKEKPVIVNDTCPTPINSSTSVGEDVARVWWPVPQATDNSGGVVSVECVPAPGSQFHLGTETVTCTATDNSSYSAACVFNVTVTDDESPFWVTFPSSMVQDITSGSSTAHVAWPDPVALDNSGSPPTVTCLPASNSSFAIGENTVSCEASDAFGNQAVIKFTVTVKAWCPGDVFVYEGGILTFPQTIMTDVQFSEEECPTDTAPDATMSVAWRLCNGSAQTGAFWSDPMSNDCPMDDYADMKLDELADKPVTEDNVDEIAGAFVIVTDDPASISGDGIDSAAEVLDNIVAVKDPSPLVTEDVVKGVNNLLQAPEDSFEGTAESSSRIVRSLEAQVSHALSTGGNFSAVTASLGVKAYNLPPASFALDGLSLATVRNESETGSNDLTEDGILIFDGDGVCRVEDIDTQIHLPSELVDHLPSNLTESDIPIKFVIYQKASLFQSRSVGVVAASAPGVRRTVVGSRIIAASVDGVKVDNLPPDASVTSTFRITVNLADGDVVSPGTQRCVFWDLALSDGIGDWSSEGCHTVSTDYYGLVACSCNHLTNFAVLVDIYGHSQRSHVLDIISKVGCGVSIVAIMITIVIYLAIKSLRVKIPSQILICLCTSLLCLYVVFLAGIEQTSSGIGCIIVAVLIHYFTLTSLAWMAVEATNMYFYLVKVLQVQHRYFLLKASLAAWGVPLLIVTLVLGLDYTQYENSKYCFLKRGNAFYYGQLLVLGMVLAFNTVIFVLVMISLYRPGKVQGSAQQRRKVMKRVQNAMAISSLTGLTWIFGILSLFEASNFAFQVLFSLFNSLQGLFIFVLFGLRQETARLAMGRCVRRHADSMLKIRFAPLGKNYRKDALSAGDNQVFNLAIRGNNPSSTTPSSADDGYHPFSVPVTRRSLCRP